MFILYSLIMICTCIVVLFLINVESKKLLHFVAQGGAGYVVYQSFLILEEVDTAEVDFQVVEFSLNSMFFNSEISCLLLGLDGVSILFYFLSSVLTFLCLAFVWEDVSFKYYSIVLLFLELLLLLIFSVMDLLFFYIFFEAVLIPMYLLIGIWGSRERKVRASYLINFYTMVTSLNMLLAILYIQYKIGTVSFIDLYLNYEMCQACFNPLEQACLWFAFFFAFATKVPMIPFHIWLPEAHVEAPTVGSVMLAGILLKLGIYGLIRVNLGMFPIASKFFAPHVCVLAIVGILYASFAAMAQSDLKRIIAYSSIAHMNLVVLGLFTLSPTGISAGIFQSISHGFVSSGLFFLIGMIYDRYHTRFGNYYYGMLYTMPIFSFFFLVFTLANIALPGSSSFIGEFLILNAAFAKEYAYGFFATIGVILSGGYSLWLYNRLVYGQCTAILKHEFSDIEYHELYILITLLMFIVMLGLFPDVYVFEFINSSCKSIASTYKS